MRNSLFRVFLLFALVFPVTVGHLACIPEPEQASFDLVVYGATSAGIAAALQTVRMAKSVALIDPGRRIGGMTTGGLGQTDIGNKSVVGGIAREFYQRIGRYYEDPMNWKWQDRISYRGGGQSVTLTGEDAMWTFEPSAALAVYRQMLEEAKITVSSGQRLDRENGVQMSAGRILSIRMESGETYRGHIFIDATYEGDLMAASGVEYVVGRESIEAFGESLNGVQTKNARYHQFLAGIDPFVIPGNPKSGLLPFVDPSGPGKESSADERVQAYCFRMCLTDHPENRIPFEKPKAYDPLWYELLLRNFEAGETEIPWINSPMPNRKTDTNNRGGFSLDFIGQNYSYPEAGYQQREEILKAHRLYQKGLMWTLANAPRVPGPIRKEVSRWGTCKDEFEREDGWQDQLYVREARRMLGAYQMTQFNCQGRRGVADVVAMGAYGMDSHNVQRYLDPDGYVRNEGDVQVSVDPYPISYRALTPRVDQCQNLLVPVCLSATHIAYGSIRMEPVFMVLGQSSATAACLAIDEEAAVQNIDYAKLRRRLLKDGQILDWEPVRLTE